MYSRTEAGLDHTAGFDVFQFGTNEGRSLTGLNMLEFDDRPDIALIFYGYAVFKVSGQDDFCHKNILLAYLHRICLIVPYLRRKFNCFL